ncbi:regulator [Raoultella ornithinolytica]|uniref:regulator n=1 Tax=Raoultella ornithinolytica TaxID=54291 RepID=UPI000E56840E|nr:regulator [Raoultella ornithinolytica]
MSALMKLLKKSQDIAKNARGNRGNDLQKLQTGENYVRIILNKDDPENAPFSHKYGIHFAKGKSADGTSTGGSAHMCFQHTHDKPCEMCEMVMEAKAKFKGNKAMEQVIKDVRASPRMAVVAMWSQKEDFSDAEKTSLIDMPISVFDDLMDAIMQDMNDEVGEPLSREKGYAYQILRTGSGIDTDYKVKPMRKNKGPVPSKFWDNQPSLEAFINQYDATKLVATSKMIARATGIALPASISSTAGALPAAAGTAALLPGMGSASITGVDDSTPEASLLDKEVEYAKDAVFEPTAEEKAVTPAAEEPATEEPAATPPADEDLDDIYAQLSALAM